MAQENVGQEIVDLVMREFRADPRLGSDFHLGQIQMESDGVLVLDGEVADLVEKKVVVSRAAAVPGAAAY